MESEIKGNGDLNRPRQNIKENQKQLKKQISCTLVRYAINLNTKKVALERVNNYKNKMKINLKYKIKGIPKETRAAGGVF